MAELVARYPHRFAGARASRPMNDVAAALAEADRAINELRFRGVEIFTASRRKIFADNARRLFRLPV